MPKSLRKFASYRTSPKPRFCAPLLRILSSAHQLLRLQVNNVPKPYWPLPHTTRAKRGALCEMCHSYTVHLSQYGNFRLMIDWVSCSFNYDGPPLGWQFLKLNLTTGHYEAGRTTAQLIEGSFTSKMSVQVVGGRMYLSGNPVKFLTGQNVFGTDDLKLLVIMSYEEVIRLLSLPDSLVSRRAFDAVCGVKLTRVDCTYHYQIGSDADVRNWLRAMSASCHVSHRGKGLYDSTMCSLLFGVTVKEGQKLKGSRYSSFKFYNKLHELSVNPPTCSPHYADAALKYVAGKVRAEALYRGRELDKHKKRYLDQWDDKTCLELHRLWLEKMKISSNMPVTDQDFLELPDAVRGTYKLWLLGVDLQDLLSKSTFYRHRAQLLKYDIDIGTWYRDEFFEDDEQFIPVFTFLEASPVCPYSEEEYFAQIMYSRRIA